MWQFLTKLTEKQTLTILLVGVALVLLSAFRGLAFAHMPITSDLWIWIIAGLGFLLVAFSIALSLIKALPDRKPNNHFKDVYSLEITSHIFNDLTPSPIELRGKYKTKPASGRVFAVERNDSRHQYYIKDEVVFYLDNTWRTQISIGNGDDKPRTLIVAYFGDDSKKLLEYFLKVRDEKSHVGIRAFPSDYHVLAEVTIVLKKP
jgi:hypothetical protein